MSVKVVFHPAARGRGPGGPPRTVVLEGDLDGGSLPAVLERLARAAAPEAGPVRLDLSAVGRCAREVLLVLVSLTGVLTRRRTARRATPRGPVEVVGVRWGQFLEVLAAEPVTGRDVMCAALRALHTAPAPLVPSPRSRSSAGPAGVLDVPVGGRPARGAGDLTRARRSPVPPPRPVPGASGGYTRHEPFADLVARALRGGLPATAGGAG